MPRSVEISRNGLPSQPAYLRAFNALGRALARLGLDRPQLEVEALLAHATRRTKLADFGDESFLAGLRKLIEELNRSAELSQTGRLVAYLNTLDHLCVRLRLIEARKQRAEIAGQTIEQPLFILGLPRTGTTILFELIAQDPAFRSPASWEVSRPLPPPRESDYNTDPRIRSVDRLLALMEKLAPGFRVIHALGAQLPQECVYLMASNFVSEQFGYMYNVPAYRSWALEQDMSATYQWHAQFLQHLQVDYRAARWVLKTPAHLAYLPALHARYPDAAIVWTHRRPLQAVASFTSLTTTLRSGFSDAVDLQAAGAFEMAHCARIVSRGMAARDELAAERFFDVSFADICRDPIAVIDGIYRHYGWALRPEAEGAMRDYLRNHPRNLYGVHRYSAAEFGLTEAQERERFADYLGRYGRLCDEG